MNPSSAHPALHIKQLSKSFGRPVVNQLNLSVRCGEFYALLGPNGAGKTTTLRMVAGLVLPDAGEISILGHNLATSSTQAKQRLAYLPDDPMLYNKLKPIEYLEFVAGLWGLEPGVAEQRGKELLEWLELSDHINELTEGFSRGMKQKLALAGALIHQPELIILDEPLTGLDASAARLVKDILLSHVKAGGTVILTTHILEVAERMAERIGIIQGGQLIAEGSLDELRKTSHTDEGNLEEIFLKLTGTPQ